MLSRGQCIPELSDKHNGLIHLIEIGVAITSCEKKTCNVHFLCLVKVTRIYIAVEETVLGFVLVSKHVPRCKEEALLYKRMDRFCAKLYNN